MQSKMLSFVFAFLVSFAPLSASSGYVSGNGHLHTTIKIQHSHGNEQKSLDRHDSVYPLNASDSLRTRVQYVHNASPTPDQKRAYADGSATVQFGKIIGVSSWNALQPTAQWGTQHIAGYIETVASFTIPDITISYLGPGTPTRTVDARLHATATVIAEGNISMYLSGKLGRDAGNGVNAFLYQVTEPIKITNAVIDMPGYKVPVGTPIDLKFQVQFISGTRSDYNSSTNALRITSTANWNLELGGSPAIILPEGYVANSADGSIVNNYYVVPTPSTSIMFTCGLLVLAAKRRRADRR